MPWKETCTMNEKMKFIVAWQKHIYSMSELCRECNISRKTGYKLISRFEQEGIEGLKPQSRAHISHPVQTDRETTKILLDLKHNILVGGLER